MFKTMTIWISKYSLEWAFRMCFIWHGSFQTFISDIILFQLMWVKALTNLSQTPPIHLTKLCCYKKINPTKFMKKVFPLTISNCYTLEKVSPQRYHINQDDSNQFEFLFGVTSCTVKFFFKKIQVCSFRCH